jgi:hypothetical protein
MPENEEVYNVYCRCSDDWVMSGGMESHRMTISAPAIKTAMWAVGGIKGQRRRTLIFDRVKMVGRAVAKEIGIELDKRREDKPKE